jgi:hypothetical protein
VTTIKLLTERRLIGSCCRKKEIHIRGVSNFGKVAAKPQEIVAKRYCRIYRGDGVLRQEFNPSPWGGSGILLHQQYSGAVAATFTGFQQLAGLDMNRQTKCVPDRFVHGLA